MKYRLLVPAVDILFSSNQNIHKRFAAFVFGLQSSDPLIDRFYYNLSIKGSEAQKKATGTFMNFAIRRKIISNIGTTT